MNARGSRCRHTTCNVLPITKWRIDTEHSQNQSDGLQEPMEYAQHLEGLWTDHRKKTGPSLNENIWLTILPLAGTQLEHSTCNLRFRKDVPQRRAEWIAIYSSRCPTARCCDRSLTCFGAGSHCCSRIIEYNLHAWPLQLFTCFACAAAQADTKPGKQTYCRIKRH